MTSEKKDNESPSSESMDASPSSGRERILDQQPEDHSNFVPLKVSGKDDAEDSLIGTVMVGRYEVIQRLSKSPASSLYKARHLLMDRAVAIRILTAADIQSVKRFQIEAKIGSSLNHPNIITVLDFGVSAGRPYIVTDYLEGRNLAELLQQTGKLSVQRALALISQICDAVTYAHKQDLLLRCLKPSQVLVLDTPDRKDFVRIVEFGISERFLVDGSEVNNLANKGIIYGDPRYISPEACLAVKLDARSDVYSVGCVLYEALVGRAPCEGLSAHETMHRHITKVPQAVREASGNLEIPEGVERAIMRSIEKDPDQRYPSMEAFWTDIQVYKHGAQQALNLNRKKPSNRTANPKQSRKQAMRVLGLSVCLFLGVLLGLALEPVKESFFAPAAKPQSERSSWQDLNRQGEEAFQKGDYREAESLFGLALAKTGGFETDDPRIAETLNNLGNLYFNLDLFSEAENAIKRALSIREKRDARGADTAASMNDLGMIYLIEGKILEAKPLIEKSLSIRQSSGEPDDEDVATGLQGMASLYHKEGKLKDALAALKKALYIRKRNLGNDHPDVATTYNSLGNQHQLAGEMGEARQCYEHARTIVAKHFGEAHPAMADSLVGLGTLDFLEENLKSADVNFKRALKIREDALGDESFRVAEVLSCLAILKERSGLYKLAEDNYRRAIAINEQAVGASNSETLRAYNNLIRVLRKSGKRDEARRIERRLQQLEKDVPTIPTTAKPAVPATPAP
ncbi:MAG: serine/threonine protein kinase [Leptolyngbya sp.]|nr:serine/threonine protein kinase [Candidatus Melainabacteria bacterium]